MKTMAEIFGLPVSVRKRTNNLLEYEFIDRESMGLGFYNVYDLQRVAQALNNHDQLVKALREIATIIETGSDHAGWTEWECKEMRAIALAALKAAGEETQ